MCAIGIGMIDFCSASALSVSRWREIVIRPYVYYEYRCLLWRWANARPIAAYRRTQRSSFAAWPTSCRPPGADELLLRWPKVNCRRCQHYKDRVLYYYHYNYIYYYYYNYYYYYMLQYRWCIRPIMCFKISQNSWTCPSDSIEFMLHQFSSNSRQLGKISLGHCHTFIKLVQPLHVRFIVLLLCHSRFSSVFLSNRLHLLYFFYFLSYIAYQCCIVNMACKY